MQVHPNLTGGRATSSGDYEIPRRAPVGSSFLAYGLPARGVME